MNNHPNRSSLAKALPSKIDVPSSPSGASKPLGRYVIAFADGRQSQWQRAPNEHERKTGVHGLAIIGWAQYDLVFGNRLQVWSNESN